MDVTTATREELVREIRELRERVAQRERSLAGPGASPESVADSERPDALTDSRELLTVFLKHSPIYAYIKDVTPTRSRVLTASENFEDMVGIPGSRMAGMAMEELFPPEFAAKITADDWAVVSAGKVLQVEEELKGRHYTTVKFPIALGGRNLLAGYTIDVTDRKRAEDELRRSHQQYQLLVDHARDGIFTVAPGGRFLFANEGTCDLLGYGRNELLGLNILDTYPEGLREQGLRRLEQIGRGDETQFERVAERKDGSFVTIDSRVWKTEDGSLQAIVRDVTERRRLEDALRRSEERYRDIVENQTDFVVRYLPGGILTFVNQSIARFTGMPAEELIGRSYYPFLHDDDRPAVLRVIASLNPAQRSRVVEGRVVLPDGRCFWHQWTHSAHFGDDGTLVEYEATGRDITGQKQLEAEKRVLEAQLLQAQKMEAIGTLAGGIAHDFNNILTPVVTNAELALRQLEDGNPVRKNIKGLLTAALRAADLVRQILAISRREGGDVSVPLSLGALAEETSRFLRATLPATIEIRAEADPGCGAVRGDASQLQQVILNLCTNAGYAMSEAGGELTIRVGQAAGEAVGRAGRWVKLSVSDTGVGIPADVREHIFEPYFTTKPVGKGSGLGLSVVHGIVSRLGGELRVESAPGAGTTFEVWLPEAETGSAPELNLAAEFPRGRGQHILVVDDEEEVRTVVRRVLRALGYRVSVSANAGDALAVFQADPRAFDAVLTDYTMPGMNGLQLGEELLRLRPGLPVVLGTGYSESVDERVVTERGFRGLIMKPYSMRKLSDFLDNVLRERFPGAGAIAR